jgi:divalent metal cation (Fe/Co/Zn/Cd) transporter
MVTAAPITPEQSKEERSLLFGIVADWIMVSSFILVGVLGGSLTIIAESIRGVLMDLIELFAYIVLRRIHRGILVDLEYGTGKLEQIANVTIGLGMLGGAAWIVTKALAVIAGERALGTSFGLTAAAIIGAVNTYINFLAWDGVRRAMHGDSTLIMHGQLKSRLVKLVSSLVVQATMTLAALSTDQEVAAWADAAGSLFVAIFIFVSAIQMLRSAIPDLLDRSAGRQVHEAVERALAQHAAAYARVHRVRSRRAGRVVFIEVALGFEPELTIAEVNRRVEALRASLQSEIDHADVSVLALAP